MSFGINPAGPLYGYTSFASVGDSTTSNTLAFSLIGGHAVQATEAGSAYVINNDFYIREIRSIATANTKDGNTVIGFRDDTSTVASVTIAAGVTSMQSSTGLNVFVASGSSCCFSRDATASTTGAITYQAIVFVLMALR